MTLWTEKDVEKVRALQKKGVIIYAVCAFIFAVLSVTILLLSKDKDYLWFMIGDTALFIAFGWASVWYFSNVFHDQRKLVALYNKMAFAEECTEKGVVKDVRGISKEGLYLYSLTIAAEGGERSLNVLPEHADNFIKDNKYVFTVRANMVTAWEAADER